MFQRFQILIKSEKNLSVFVYGKSRTNKVNSNYKNTSIRPCDHILPVFHIVIRGWTDTRTCSGPGDTEIQSNLEGGLDG